MDPLKVTKCAVGDSSPQLHWGELADGKVAHCLVLSSRQRSVRAGPGHKEPFVWPPGYRTPVRTPKYFKKMY